MNKFLAGFFFLLPFISIFIGVFALLYFVAPFDVFLDSLKLLLAGIGFMGFIVSCFQLAEYFKKKEK